MNSEELMIGDWYTNSDGDICKVVKNLGNVVWGQGDDVSDSTDDPNPIPLTTEILEKNGWKEAQYWHEYQDGRSTVQCCLPDMQGMINGVFIEHFQCEYVHQYQHLLRLCGLTDLADNFKV